MTNFDKYIANFLSNNKRLTAQGLGEFVVVSGQALNGAPAVEFTANKQVPTSEELVSYVAELEHKNKVVTGFDLEAHFNQVKQFINIGTPWMIPGFGQLQLGKNRELEFVQSAPTENILHERIKRKQAAAEEQQSTYEPSESPSEKRSNTGTVLLTVLIVLALGAGGLYFYLNENSTPVSAVGNDTPATITDTLVSVPSSSNMNSTTTATQPPGMAPAAPSATTTTATNGNAGGYKFILNRTPNSSLRKKTL